MAEIKSESVAGFIPESVAALLRNQQKARELAAQNRQETADAQTELSF